MQRPSWEGHLKLSLVACPVALFSATTRGNDISFHLIHKKTRNRIRMVPHDPKLGAVKRTDLERGYEVSKNKYVILTEKEIAAARIESTKNIEIESFVDMDGIDRVYWDQPITSRRTARMPWRPTPSSARRWKARSASPSAVW
jgi:DNA end-binding protein Ku